MWIINDWLWYIFSVRLRKCWECNVDTHQMLVNYYTESVWRSSKWRKNKCKEDQNHERTKRNTPLRQTEIINNYNFGKPTVCSDVILTNDNNEIDATNKRIMLTNKTFHFVLSILSGRSGATWSHPGQRTNQSEGQTDSKAILMRFCFTQMNAFECWVLKRILCPGRVNGGSADKIQFSCCAIECAGNHYPW